uniref:Reverse transcriptase domain-containing protein n=1 Tax=Graphocephala atropunctata TaxID=36148 RepID=A0A1B6KRB6_9HEMI
MIRVSYNFPWIYYTYTYTHILYLYISKRFNQEIKKFLSIEGPKENINEETLSLLTPDTPRTPVFYILPKIHKSTRPPPGRPIVSGYGSPTERLSSYVDEILQPIVKNLKSHIKNTDHFIERLKEVQQPLPDDVILVTIDAQSLYTNIPHNLGEEAVNSFLSIRPKPASPSTKFVMSLINMILTMNNFRFKNQNYLQINGTAMGTRMAPAYANLFMGKLEEDFLNSQPYKPLMWLRFIDDIFMIWNNSTELLKNFLENLNKFSILKFTWNFSKNILTFLDVDVFVQSGYLKTKIHIKETNTMDYLHFNSCHPVHVKKSIPKGLSVRAKKLCSNNVDFHNYVDKLGNAFVRRNYPPKFVHNQIKHKKLHVDQSKSVQNDVQFVTKYFPGLYKTNNVLKTAYKILESSPITKNLFLKPPRIVFSRNTNLKNLLVRPKLPQIKQQNSKKNISGCRPCNDKRCATCKIIKPSNLFNSSTTNKTYPIIGNINCKTKNVVYQLT